MKFMRYSLLHLLCVSSLMVAEDQESVMQPWTWLLYRGFSEQETLDFKQKNDIFFVKENVDYFTQLVFSWNAFRPTKGYFSFWIQARDVATKKWGPWHHMMDWGNDVQKSYRNAPLGAFTRYDFVRLEVKESTVADGFKIRIAVHDGASLEQLKSFAVSLSNFNLFKSENIDTEVKNFTSQYIDHVPALSQFQIDHPRSDGLCSPTSCTMLTSYLTNKEIDPLDFARKSFDSGLDAFGSWPFNMAHAFEECNGNIHFFTTRLNSFSKLYKRLEYGIPVVVSVRGLLPGQASPYRFGHLLAVIGYDHKKQEVICHDPAFKTPKSVVHRYPLRSFLEAWERSRRLAYIAEYV